MSQPNTTAGGDLITVPAAELQAVLTQYDAAATKAAAVIEAHEKTIADLTAKQAGDLTALREAAASAMVEFGAITPAEKQAAVDQLADPARALQILANAVNPAKHAAHRPGLPIPKTASTSAGDAGPKGRFNDQPTVRQDVDKAYFDTLGITL